jgi:hypothetical protein
LAIGFSPHREGESNRAALLSSSAVRLNPGSSSTHPPGWRLCGAGAIFLAECLLMSKDIKKQSVNIGKTPAARALA